MQNNINNGNLWPPGKVITIHLKTLKTIQRAFESGQQK